jgi:hypothetical protein
MMKIDQRQPLTIPNPSPVPRGWPKPLNDVALRGLVGEVVRTIAPHTEADPAALALEFAVGYGNIIGREAHFRVEANRHGTNLYLMLVGQTARSRKGTSFGHIECLLAACDPDWTKQRIQSGLSSGEGLIAAIADEHLNESGSHDSRLLFFEDEFASVLRVMSRYGNTLSTTLRHAWDSRPLQVLTKESPMRVTTPHISLIGHITQEDLSRYMPETDIRNGMGNRVLWCCARRSKLLPNGGHVPKKDFRRLVRAIRDAVDFGKSTKQTSLSSKAQVLWEKEYPILTADIEGLVGAVTSRAEAQVRRLATVYALMDRSGQVKLQHLRAALEAWRFCRDSAQFVFGDRSVPLTTEDKLLGILRTSRSGLTRTQISAAFKNHLKKDTLSTALEHLQKLDLAHSSVLPTAGRSAERWFANDVHENGRKEGPEDEER